MRREHGCSVRREHGCSVRREHGCECEEGTWGGNMGVV